MKFQLAFFTAVVVLASGLLLGSVSEAREPKATLCATEAKEAASALFTLNVKPTKPVSMTSDLIDMAHGEGGSEVWDISFSVDGVSYSPYRITVSIDGGCTVVGFEMPFAG